MAVVSTREREKINLSLQAIAETAWHEGRRACRKKYEDSGLLVLNPNVNWEELEKNPCKDCPDKSYDLYQKLAVCNHAIHCEKYQTHHLVCELLEHFKKP